MHFHACCVNKPAGNRHYSRSLGCLRHPMLPLCCFSGQTPCHGTELGLEREKGALSCTNPRLTLDATDDLSSLMQGLSIWGERQFLAVFSPRFQHETLGIDFDISDPKVCVVVRIDPFGQAATWNQTAGRKQIKLHDRLVSVNDQRLRAADLVQKVQTSGSLELMFERPEPCNCTKTPTFLAFFVEFIHLNYVIPLFICNYCICVALYCSFSAASKPTDS